MNNQDDVARHLIRVSAAEMHKLVSIYGNTGQNRCRGWQEIANDSKTHNFIQSHGWTLAEYAADCRKVVNVPKRQLSSLYYAFLQYE